MEEEKRRESVRKAIKKYDDKCDRVNCRFEPGTKERITATGYTINNFIKEAVNEKLERLQA